MGVKTLLIDLDLRKRSLSRQILGNKTQPGLVEFLQGHATFEEILQPTTVENCFVIPAGGFIENPAELLRKNVLQPLIQVALQSFEKIVIDTPPILSVSDALILASDIEKIYLTAWSGKSHGVALRNACHALISSGRSPDGIILNAIHSRHSNYYYYYGKKEHYGEPDNSGILKK